MKEAGFIDAVTTTRNCGGQTSVVTVDVKGLTWAGHDFLTAARSDGIWNKAKDTLIKRGVPASFEVLKALLIMEAKQHLGL